MKLGLVWPRTRVWLPWLGIAAAAALVGVGWRLWIGSGQRAAPAAPDRRSLTEGKTPPDAVFLVVVDTLRADRLSCYGYRGHKTPNIDRLAAAGTQFDSAHAVASWTCPSMAALLTSRYPRQLGTLERPAQPGQRFGPREKRDQVNRQIPPGERTAGELFRAAGFHTAAFVNQAALNATSAYARGFADYYYPLGPDDVRRFDPGSPPGKLQGWETDQYQALCDAALVRQFGQWLEPNAAQKLFVWIHLLSPHGPYKPPAEYAPQPRADGEKPTDSDAYDGEIRYVDALVGELLQTIERCVGLERSLIVFTSDHGEEFREHGQSGHGHSLHYEVNRVPLLLVAPRLLPTRTVAGPVRLIDLLPTLLTLTGVAHRASVFEGTSLVSAITTGQSDLPVYAEGMLYGNTQRSLSEHGFKLIFDEAEKRSLLYDVAKDAAETNDLAAQEPARAASLLSRMNEWRDRLQRDFEIGGHARPESRSTEEQDRERRAMLEALRSLGYVDDSTSRPAP